MKQDKVLHFTIYKVVNNVNQMEYIGQHRTTNPNDSYMGSGLYIQRAIKKYGKHSFTKIILFDFDNAKDMDNKEIELVTKEYISSANTYNLIPGGYQHNRNESGYILLKNEKLRRSIKWPINKAIPDILIQEGWEKGIYRTPAQIEKSKECKRGDKNPMRKRKGKFKLIKNEKLGVQKVIPKDNDIPFGWTVGTLDSVKDAIAKSKTDELRLNLSEKMKGNPGNTNRKKIYNIALNQERFLLENEQLSDELANQGWKYGSLVKPTCQMQAKYWVTILGIKFSLVILSKLTGIGFTTLRQRYPKKWPLNRFLYPYLEQHSVDDLIKTAIQQDYDLTAVNSGDDK